MTDLFNNTHNDSSKNDTENKAGHFDIVVRITNQMSTRDMINELIERLNNMNMDKHEKGGLSEAYDARSEEIDILSYKLNRLYKVMI